MCLFQASAKEGHLIYRKPTYDTYSFGILLLHMCVGYPNEDFNNEVRNKCILLDVFI